MQYEKAKVAAVSSVDEKAGSSAVRNVSAIARHSIATTTLHPNSFPVEQPNAPVTNGPISSMIFKFIGKFFVCVLAYSVPLI